MEIKSEDVVYMVCSVHTITHTDMHGNDWPDTDHGFALYTDVGELLDVVGKLKSDPTVETFQVIQGRIIYTHPQDDKCNSAKFRKP